MAATPCGPMPRWPGMMLDDNARNGLVGLNGAFLDTRCARLRPGQCRAARQPHRQTGCKHANCRIARRPAEEGPGQHAPFGSHPRPHWREIAVHRPFLRHRHRRLGRNRIGCAAEAAHRPPYPSLPSPAACAGNRGWSRCGTTASACTRLSTTTTGSGGRCIARPSRARSRGNSGWRSTPETFQAMSIRTPMRIVGFLAAAAALVWLLTGPHVWWSPDVLISTHRQVVATADSKRNSGSDVDNAPGRDQLQETVALQEAISDADGNVVIQGWGPRPVVIGGLSSSEPKVRIVHRQYRITVLQPEPDYVDAHMES